MRTATKRALSRAAGTRPGEGLTVLIYHRVGGGTPDERDLPAEAFSAQLELLADRVVVSLDEGLDRLDAGDRTPAVALTFDDGFEDVHSVALPLLEAHGYPFTLYLASAYVGKPMQWEGSAAQGAGPSLSMPQLRELAASGLCTVANHTHSHCLPERLTEAELDECSEWISEHLGVVPRHFAYPWGVRVPAMEPALRSRFRSSATGVAGRNLPGDDLHRLARVPVRASDPLEFFEAKLNGKLRPERAYAAIVATAKRVGVRG